MTPLKSLVAALALATVAAPSFAAPETYKLDAGHTFPRFSYSHFGLSTQLSRFNRTTGTVTLDRAAKTGAVDITIDTKSVDTGFPLFNEHIQAEDFLDTAKVIAGLDVVVSTESTVAHLAAAMGVRTCVLATQNAHWCWAGWYVDAQLCPQREAGNWNGPMSDVAGMLLTLPVAA